MTWKADRTTTLAAIAMAVAGIGRIIFSRDWVMGAVLIGLSVVIAVRAFIYYRKPDA